MMSLQDALLKQDQEKKEIEIQRLKLEIEQLKREKSIQKVSLIALFLPLLIAAISLSVGVVNQNRDAELQFQLKAAEIIMDSNNALGTYNRARALTALFPDRLPDGFAASFDPSLYGGISSDTKKELLTLIVENPDQKQQVIEMWKRLFPRDDWVDVLSD